jgi:hypothetical protein
VETYATFAIRRATIMKEAQRIRKKKYPQSEEKEGKLKGKLFKLEKLLFFKKILIKLKNYILSEIPQFRLHFPKVLAGWLH